MEDLKKENSLDLNQFYYVVGEKIDLELVKAILPMAQWATIMFTISRVILLLISIKNIRVCKMYFYFEQLVMLA